MQTAVSILLGGASLCGATDAITPPSLPNDSRTGHTLNLTHPVAKTGLLATLNDSSFVVLGTAHWRIAESLTEKHESQ